MAQTLANAVALVAALPELSCDELSVDPNLVTVADQDLMDCKHIALTAFSSPELAASLAPVEALVCVLTIWLRACQNICCLCG